MIYILYNNREEIEGEFSTITDLELYVDTVRELRNERYPNTPRLSCFDYIKSIGWLLTIKDGY